MANSSFWLVHADNSYVTVGLCQITDGRPTLASLGQPFPWTNLEPESIITAVDESLSQASTMIGLPSEEEPSSSAFVVSPFWLDNEGKITHNYLKLIESVCKKLDLKPLGFIPNDEAILESFSVEEGLPSSFVLVHLSPTSFDLSLIYLGKIKERAHHELASSFTPSDLETALSQLNSDSTLPPQIIVFGSYSQATIESLKNYSWVGKKNVETFLHFPDVVPYSDNDVFAIFLKVISSQFKSLDSENTKPDILPVSEDSQDNPPEVGLEDPVPEDSSVSSLETVDAEDFGFQKVMPETLNPDPIVMEPQREIIQTEEIPENTNKPAKQRIKISLPKIRIPLNFSKLPLILLALSPLFVLAFLFLVKVDISLSVTPYSFDKSETVNFDLSGNPSSSDYPVKVKSVDLDAVASIPVTGQKTVGEKAVGEVVIFNQFSSKLNLKKGSVLTSDSGLKYELTTNVEVAGSSADYDTGTITMGQTKANITASEIGEEYNLGKDQKLFIKDSSGTQILTKVKEGLTGGVKRQIQAVSAEDKTEVDRQINTKIESLASDSSSSEIKNTPGILPNTVISKKQRIEYNRQVGEESSVLEASSKSTISVYYLDEIDKSIIINKFFASDPDFKTSSLSLSDFTFDFVPSKSSVDKTSGLLRVTGKTMPKIDLAKLASSLTGKTPSQAKKIINSFSGRINDYTTTPRLPLLPLIKSNILIKIK